MSETGGVERYLRGRLVDGRWAPAWVPEGIRTQISRWARAGVAEPLLAGETGRWVVRTGAGTWLVAILRDGGAYVTYEPAVVPSAALLDFLFGAGPLPGEAAR